MQFPRQNLDQQLHRIGEIQVDMERVLRNDTDEMLTELLAEMEARLPALVDLASGDNEESLDQTFRGQLGQILAKNQALSALIKHKLVITRNQLRRVTAAVKAVTGYAVTPSKATAALHRGTDLLG